MEAPDVLVLGGGGILGEAWMSAVLAGIEEAGRLRVRDCDCFVGTSAGSIVAAARGAGARPAAGEPARRGSSGRPGCRAGGAGRTRRGAEAGVRRSRWVRGRGGR